MNPYIQNLNRIEFLITLACTGSCKHCSEGDHLNSRENTHEHAREYSRKYIDSDVAAETIKKLARVYNLKSLMTFGGEPLLYPDVVCKIHAAARDEGIPERQIITNGFFSRDEAKIQSVAKDLAECGVNNLLLSVDAFHQESIPLEPVITFAKAVQVLGIPKFRVHPAWLVSEDANNSYNNKTREILEIFNKIGIPTSSGNVIFPSGNALKYLSEYFDNNVNYTNQYVENDRDIKAICVSPNGEVLGGNIYKTDILNILENYIPETEII